MYITLRSSDLLRKNANLPWKVALRKYPSGFVSPYILFEDHIGLDRQVSNA